MKSRNWPIRSNRVLVPRVIGMGTYARVILQAFSGRLHKAYATANAVTAEACLCSLLICCRILGEDEEELEDGVKERSPPAVVLVGGAC